MYTFLLNVKPNVLRSDQGKSKSHGRTHTHEYMHTNIYFYKFIPTYVQFDVVDVRRVWKGACRDVLLRTQPQGQLVDDGDVYIQNLLPFWLGRDLREELDCQ